MKKKLTLKNLKVKSFVTVADKITSETLKGGSTQIFCPAQTDTGFHKCSIVICPDRYTNQLGC